MNFRLLQIISSQGKKVLSTLLDSEEFKPREFCKKINDYGLDEDQKILGLKAKERELKEEGRYFCLMSSEARDYFVFTEYLIKKDFLPLFDDITMSDSLHTLMQKMKQRAKGQGVGDYSQITFANHLDYEKWNNHQRYESTEAVFSVLGNAYGLPNLFLRTHEIFQESWIYFADRPDLIRVVHNAIVSLDPNILSCWNGQDGGLEGLRQKGWCLNNMLMTDREDRNKTVKADKMASGDNQIIYSNYTLKGILEEELIQIKCKEIFEDNQDLMENIRKGASKIGLHIKEDETVQSADFMIYGKTMLFCGN